MSMFFPPKKTAFGILAWLQSQNVYFFLIVNTASAYAMSTWHLLHSPEESKLLNKGWLQQWMHIIILLGSPFFVKQLAYFMKKKNKIPIKRCLDIDQYKDICFRLIMKQFNTIRQGFNTIAQSLRCMMDKINISLSGVNRLQ